MYSAGLVYVVDVKQSFSPSAHPLAVIGALELNTHTLQGLLTSNPTGATGLSDCSLQAPVSLKSLSITVEIASVHGQGS